MSKPKPFNLPFCILNCKTKPKHKPNLTVEERQQDRQATEIIGNNVRISGQNVCYNVLVKCMDYRPTPILEGEGLQLTL